MSGRLKALLLVINGLIEDIALNRVLRVRYYISALHPKLASI